VHGASERRDPNGEMIAQEGALGVLRDAKMLVVIARAHLLEREHVHELQLHTEVIGPFARRLHPERAIESVEIGQDLHPLELVRASIHGLVERHPPLQMKEGMISAPEPSDVARELRRAQIRRHLFHERQLQARGSRRESGEHLGQFRIAKNVHHFRRGIEEGQREDPIQASPHRGLAHRTLAPALGVSHLT
jgi:hypothetical protein